MRTFVQALVVFPPLLGALAAPLFGLIWVMGFSAFSGTEKSNAANIGLWALIIYVVLYPILIAIVAVCIWQKWRIVNLFQGLIWLCFILCGGTVLWSMNVLLVPDAIPSPTNQLGTENAP